MEKKVGLGEEEEEEKKEKADEKEEKKGEEKFYRQTKSVAIGTNHWKIESYKWSDMRPTQGPHFEVRHTTDLGSALIG